MRDSNKTTFRKNTSNAEENYLPGTDLCFNCPEKSQNNGDQPPPQRPSRYQQDVNGGTTLLVAENH